MVVPKDVELSVSRQLRETYDPLLTIMSPPRCASTVVARSLWRHPRFRWYAHEPYDRAYHDDGGVQTVLAAVRDPLDALLWGKNGELGTGLIVKEMTFQARCSFAELVDAATLPIIVTVRDPRRAIVSRMRQRAAAGQQPGFPHEESGWFALRELLDCARARRRPYAVVDTGELRERPEQCLRTLCERLGLGFTDTLLSWPGTRGLTLGQLGTQQRNWYDRVLASTGFEPETEATPELTDIPRHGGMRRHAAECLEIYRVVTAEQQDNT